MRHAYTSRLLAVLAAVIGGIVSIAELSYWLTHLRRPGPAVYIALCGLAIVLLSASTLLAPRDRQL